MCGIIGLNLPHATEEDLEQLRTVMLESSIRGRHASGIVWHDGLRLHRLVADGPMEGLLATFDPAQMVRPDGSVLAIGHARYSTSDLLYHQPLVASGWALAHNGVVSQADPQQWQAQYGYACEGRNDSELLLRALVAGEDPLGRFPAASVAAVWITPKGELRHLRNGLRPMWWARIGGSGAIFASTADILRRAGLEPQRVHPRGSHRPDLQAAS